ncbi:winged helix-turn-helix transcriptional regulator [Nakamurella flavida]|uniref:Winged helix-turn-helix transcriptional regulator n=1 Tax=Nakamurella flavida TaxID=363630 RepID=A0A938YNY9_9ACTN|nr:MarR family winged helix-turn-helix transcriptional regulator [Nakamurella flavida]MBM9476847.1 winged helix-turn-helix transcriptional regulator [Nakamurella flavida]MDP9778710.1 DNA-binding MarR family transcriptional regulator [Nakamurella flavida]
MTVSTQSCAELLHRLPVLAQLKRGIRRSGTTVGTSVLTALATLDGAPAPAAPSAPATAPGAGTMPDPSCCRLGTLADQLQVDLSVASRQVTQLIEMGAVVRVPDPTDRRVHLLRVTESGHREIVRARDRAAEQLATRLTSWSEDDLQTLVSLLGRLQSDLRRTDPGPDPGGAPPGTVGPTPLPSARPISTESRP